VAHRRGASAGGATPRGPYRSADGTPIDARSSSRYGSFDFGTNANRVRALLEEIEDAMDNQKPERPATPVAKKAKAAPKGNQPAAKR
jgi:hypothetical protein